VTSWLAIKSIKVAEYASSIIQTAFNPTHVTKIQLCSAIEIDDGYLPTKQINSPSFILVPDNESMAPLLAA